MEYNAESIINLIRRFQAGDIDAFNGIYESCYMLVYSTCYGIIKDEEDARDVAQDAFVQMYEKLSTLNNPVAYGKWMKLIASNMSMSFIRRKGHTYNFEDDAEMDAAVSDWTVIDQLPDSFIEEDEKRDIINKVLKESLSEVQYQTIFMYYFSEMPLASIAETMKCPEGTVKTRLMHAKDKFKKALENYIDDNKLVLAATPFLTRFFEASLPGSRIPQITLPDAPGLPGTGTGGASASAGSGAGGAASGAASSAVPVAAGSVLTGAKVGFFSTVAGKIIAAGLALTLVGTAAAVGFVVFKDKDKPEETTVTTMETAVTTDTTNASANTTSASDATADTTANPSAADLSIGSSYTFGNYRGEDIEWIVLDKQDNGVLLLSKKVIDTKPFNESDVKTTWENCTLRGWLNNDFCQTAFSSSEREQILKTHVITPDNPTSGADGGNDTDDYCFLLSIDEVNKYISTDEDRKARVRDYISESDLSIFDGCSSWWLRSPSSDTVGKYATQFGATVSSDGYVNDYGEWITTPLGVRPAIWISDYPSGGGTTESSAAETVTDPRVRVEDAHYETIRNYFDTEMVNRYPRIIIDGIDTSAVNKKMENEMKRVWTYDPDTNTYKGQVINYRESVADYEYYIYGDTVSIIGEISDVDTDYSEYKIYNVSITTGKELSGSDIVSQYGMSDKEFFEIVKKIYKDFGGGGDFASDAEAKKCIKMNLKRVSYKYIKPFFAKDGHLCFAGYVSFAGAWGEGDILFDATTVGSFYGSD